MSRRRCPPGVFCIENITIVFIVGILSLIGLFLYAKSGSTSIKIHTTVPSMSMGLAAAPRKGHGDDVFFDIYQPPLRDDRCMTGGALDIRGTVPVSHVPINVSTQGTDDSEFRQIGIITPVNGNDERILPLMGRPLFTRRDKWNFYTLNDKNNMIKLPVTVKGRPIKGRIVSSFPFKRVRIPTCLYLESSTPWVDTLIGTTPRTSPPAVKKRSSRSGAL